jgi:protein SCO1/2
MAAHALRMKDGAGRFDANLLRIDEAAHLGGSVADVAVRTASGTRSLLSLADGEPLILALVYYGCGHSCPVTLRGLAAMERAATDDFRILAVSFDPKDTLDAMAAARDALGPLSQRWSFGLLDEAAAMRLTDSVGFRYFYSEPDGIFVHPAALVFISPQGRITRYLYGAPEPRDVSLALLESRDELPRASDVLDMLKLSCFQFDSSRSRYVLHPTLIFGGAGIGLLALVGLAAMASRGNSQGGPA